MPELFRVFVLLLVLSCFVLVPAYAAPQATTSLAVEWPDDGPHFLLWIEGSDGTCRETQTDVFECWELGDDYAHGTCQLSCLQTTIQNVAGCADKTVVPRPDILDPAHTVACPNGRKFELKGITGDSCDTNTENDAVTGGQCQQTDADGEVQVSAAADCEKGCTHSEPPGDCTEK